MRVGRDSRNPAHANLLLMRDAQGVGPVRTGRSGPCMLLLIGWRTGDAHIPGGTFFFTVVTDCHRPIFRSNDARTILIRQHLTPLPVGRRARRVAVPGTFGDNFSLFRNHLAPPAALCVSGGRVDGIRMRSIGKARHQRPFLAFAASFRAAPFSSGGFYETCIGFGCGAHSVYRCGVR